MISKLSNEEKIFLYKLTIVFSLIICLSSLIISKIALNKNEELRVSVKKYQQELAKARNSKIKLKKEIKKIKAELKETVRLRNHFYGAVSYYEKLYYDHIAICPLFKNIKK